MANKVTQATSTDPVKRTKRTSKAETVFLQLVTDGATITEAAEQSGIGRRTVYEWRDQF